MSNNAAGTSLVELVIVVAIIGCLAGIGLPEIVDRVGRFPRRLRQLSVDADRRREPAGPERGSDLLRGRQVSAER